MADDQVPPRHLRAVPDPPDVQQAAEPGLGPAAVGIARYALGISIGSTPPSAQEVVDEIRARLVAQAGGEGALDALDATPLPDEAFDPSGIPDDIVAQVERVAVLADGFADAHGDVEFRTAVRRLLALVGREGPMAFRRNATEWSSAAAACKAIGDATGLLTPYRGAMTNKAFMAHWGKTGSVKGRADAMLRAAGIQDSRALPAHLLPAAQRQRLIEQRDQLPALLALLGGPDEDPSVRSRPRRAELEPLPGAGIDGPCAHVLKVTIASSKPPIWRRLVVPGQVTFAGLHEILQVAFEWDDYHLHEFEVAGRRFVPAEDLEEFGEFGPPCFDEAGTTLAAALGPGDRCTYTYDFGDSWEHRIEVEAVEPLEVPQRRVTCLGGRRAAPPEDCGGIWSYNDMAAHEAGKPLPSGDRRPDLTLDEAAPPDFDPAAFDAEELHELLGHLRL